MKKIICVLCFFSLIFVSGVTGCGADGGSGASHGETKSQVDTVIQDQIAAQGAAKEAAREAENMDGTSEKTEIKADTSNSKENTGVSENTSRLTEDEVALILGKNDPAAPLSEEELPESDVDIDLTLMSSTMVYSQVLQMMIEPDGIKGKSVRMKGLYSYYHNDENNKDYHACIVQDATACCAQGIEFILNDSYKYPDDYPKDFEEITVKGIFDTYEEDGMLYCTLREAELEQAD
ncbi:MAG: hypothetical protein K6G03_05775 [Lachnospiraceae bacterium]|nr:hypothetical protein [Lachnospiraceae bacterium]